MVNSRIVVSFFEPHLFGIIWGVWDTYVIFLILQLQMINNIFCLISKLNGGQEITEKDCNVKFLFQKE